MKEDQLTEADQGGQWCRANPEEFIEGEWLDWYRLTPQERWRISHKVLWPMFLALGGSLQPDVDTQSPFFDPEEHRGQKPAQTRLRVISRSGV